MFRAHMKRTVNGRVYDTATASKIAEAERRTDEDFTAILYRTPEGSFFVDKGDGRPSEERRCLIGAQTISW
jgi:hypothetical protein